MKTIACAILLMSFGCMIGDGSDGSGDDPADYGSGGSGGDMTEDSHAITGCASITTVLLYSEGTSELTLPNAFAANANTCTRYYVNLPALAADKTMPRMGADKVRALGPNFHAMAEFSWGAWRDWIAASPGTRDWKLAGQAFRNRMAAAGYDVASGDTWAINEFPTTTRTGENDVWTHEISAVNGLHDGDGSQPPSAGVAYIAGMGQTLTYFTVYKSSVEGWLQQDAWWSAMSQNVRWLSLEVYADPHYNCVIGSNVVANERALNEYTMHLPEIAAAGGSRTSTAHAYLDHAFVPLLNAAWNSNVGFGNNLVDLGDFERFSRLQVYGTHVWAANHATPGRRIGFAWAPKNSTADQDAELSTVIARSVQRAYPTGSFYGEGKFACSTDGSLNGCGCTVSGSYNNAWSTFANW